jgi:hypothetical protein
VPDTSSLKQLHRIHKWLAQHGDGRGEGMEIADAMIAFAEDKLAVIRSLERQIEIEHFGRRAAQWIAESEERRAAIDHAAKDVP